MFTFLPAPSTEGLQILNRRNMKWIRIAAPRGTIILNTGDYMQRISNDIFPSTTHRVSKPRDPAQRGRARVSFPMAVYLWEDEMLEVLPGIEQSEVPAGEGDRVSHEHHQQVLRRRLRGEGVVLVWRRAPRPPVPGRG